MNPRGGPTHATPQSTRAPWTSRATSRTFVSSHRSFEYKFIARTCPRETRESSSRDALASTTTVSADDATRATGATRATVEDRAVVRVGAATPRWAIGADNRTVVDAIIVEI